MNVCFLIADISGGGGTERVTCMIANGLSRRGMQVGIISCRGSGNSSYELDASVRIYALHGENSRVSPLRRAAQTAKIWNLIRRRRFDIVIAVDLYLYLYLLPAQMTGLCKCIAWEHFNFYIESMKFSSVARNTAMKWADKVIVLGKRDLGNYRRHYPNADKVVCIYNPAAFSNTKYRGADSFRVMAAGRLSAQKGFDLLIEAWKIIEHDPETDVRWRLDIYGEGEEEANLNKKIEEYDLKRIHLMGYTNDLERELEKSSVFVLSSRYEGFVLVLLEAQSKGLPCVSFKCREGPEEIIDDGVNGFLAEKENTGDLAKKLTRLMKDRSLRVRFGEHAHKDLKRFEAESVLDSWEELLYGLRECKNENTEKR